MLTYVIIFIFISIIFLSYVFLKNKEFLDSNTSNENNNQPVFRSKSYEEECKECCLIYKNKKKECVKNCYSGGFKCLCC
jgi:hypothetical protein